MEAPRWEMYQWLNCFLHKYFHEEVKSDWEILLYLQRSSPAVSLSFYVNITMYSLTSFSSSSPPVCPLRPSHPPVLVIVLSLQILCFSSCARGRLSWLATLITRVPAAYMLTWTPRFIAFWCIFKFNISSQTVLCVLRCCHPPPSRCRIEPAAAASTPSAFFTLQFCGHCLHFQCFPCGTVVKH